MGLTLALAMTGLSPIAAADPSPSPAPTVEAAESAAVDEARRTGRRTEVLESRTETTEVFAEPDGSMTRSEYVRPVRAKINGRWTAVDDDLRRNADGTYSPAASTFPMTFSGGGSGTPLATMAKGGSSMSLMWPGALPEPSISGDTATYAEVLPDVDLLIIANPDGFVHHLVVKNRAAAANPALRTLRFGLRERGVNVSETPVGGLRATAPGGQEVFTAPEPTMWDSSHRSKKILREAPMAAEVSGDRLEIVPDATLLDDPATVYPVTIDPSWHGGYKNHWATAAKRAGHPSVAGTAFYDGGNRLGAEWPPEARVGYERETGITARSFFEMNMHGLGGAQVERAVFRIRNVHSWSGEARQLDVGLTDAIGPGTTWNNQPTWHRTVASASFAHGWGANPAANVEFDVTSVAQQAVNGHWPHATIGLKAANESDTKGWKKFLVDVGGDWWNYVPVLSVSYNRAPKMTSSVAYQGPWSGNGSDRPIPCGPAWITVGGTGVTLTASAHDPDGDNVGIRFIMSLHDGPLVLDATHWIGSGGTAHLTLRPDQLQDNGHYWWRASATDGRAEDWSLPACPIKVDKSAPPPVNVTGPDDQALGVATARRPFTVRLSNGDWNLTGFCYAVEENVDLSGGTCKAGTWVPVNPGVRSADVPIAFLTRPVSRLKVAAVDEAGNVSPTAEILVKVADPAWVADRPGAVGTKDRPGDLTGDGLPDLLTVNAGGHLRLYRGRPNSGQFDEYADVTAASPDWSRGTLLAHRGDFTSPAGPKKDGYEDVFARHTSGKLILHPGDGTGRPASSGRIDYGHPEGRDWSRVTQLVAPGPFDLDPGNDLLVVENGRLWLYTGTVNGPLMTGDLGKLAAPVEVTVPGITDFSAYDVLVPVESKDLILRKRDTGQVSRARGDVGSGYTAPAPIGGELWPASGFPVLAMPGDLQGKVVDGAFTGDGGSDFYVVRADTPGLYLYPLSGTGRGPAVQVGGSGWHTWVHAIF
ncbi:DNRLRE domain-containing protein [Rhizohabitans arisaemae]|uniref:DNRLRE domain-containing protein n=1 Tax=Rhizohabitans arisaemae TaxID=2720610 RepID=UPI0024B0C0C1|nr:DNRLRE domain-containing protein [Rhizohabitans arisaemae]